MNIYICRTCTEVAQGRQDNPTERPQPKPLREFAERPAIILLGAPGAGKTITFKREAGALAGCYVTARDFVTFDDRPEWHGKTLFIDGLDEMRAGSSDQRTPFDQIRAKLDQLGRPCFRLSCREADWFGATDRTHLESVSSKGEVLVLRLDPLSGKDIRKILSHHQGIEDIDEFTSRAQQKDINALLENPQTLEMLVASVASGRWPETRTQTFESACLKLLSELNPEHRLAAPSKYSDAELLDTAGHLCALLLLSGRARCATMASQTDADSILLSEISGPSQEILTRTIHTKLFKVENGLAEPIHRHIAEFLAGRHLAGVIANGLPAGRILALITGDDGGLVSELRGLAAWLAAHSTLGRSTLIELDPHGVVAYGDVKRYSVDEKRLVFTCLEPKVQDGPWTIANERELEPRWGDLATADMVDSFASRLAKDTKTDAEETVASAVLTAMRHGTTMPSLKPTLMNLMKDGKNGIETRMLALETYIEKFGSSRKAEPELRSLLSLVYSGNISDPYDGLLGRILYQLYPETIPPSEICRYFRAPKSDTISSWYKFFWSSALIKKTEGATQLTEVLDGFVALYDVQPSRNDHSKHAPKWIGRTLESLLRKFLGCSKNGNRVDAERLLNWLDLLAGFTRNRHSEFSKYMRQWFGNHPKQYKSIFKATVERPMPFCTSADFLFHASPPEDFSSWCLDQALDAKDENLAYKFLVESMEGLSAGKQSDGLPQEAFETRLAERPNLLNCYKERTIQRQQGRDQQAEREKQALEEQQRAKEEQRKRSERWCNAVERHETELRESRAPPSLLHQLAKAYFGFFLDIDGNTGRERLLSLLGGDEHLADLVLSAFRESTKRKDLPQASEIFRLSTQNQQHHLALPFMAGCKELAGEISLGHPPLDRNGVHRALALHFIETLPPSDNWLRLDPILIRQPDVVSESLVRAFRVTIHKRAEHCMDLYPLAGDPSYSKVAGIAAPQMMEAFPNRCTVKQLKMLKQILVAALRYCEEGKFLKVVEKKLDLKSLNTAQRVYWLAARLLRCPQSTTAPLAEALTGKGGERQTTHLAAFLTEELNPWIANLDLGTKELLAQAIGKLYRPYPDGRGGWISEAEGAGRPLVHNLVGQIAATPTTQATETLKRLAEHPALCHWHPRLRHAAHEHREVRREACFTHASPHQVQRTLDNSGPANVADLAAMVLDHLDGLAVKIRRGETSDWRQYWNTDSAKHPKEPKHEGLCRDALLSDLLLRLKPLGINAGPEGQYGNDRRADIRICYEGLNVPIEVKKNSHRDLWTAMHNQLIGKYSQDPDANGHGIYLVFWFGPEKTEVASPKGERPKTAKELQRSLSDTLSKAESRRISVLVIDVSKPATQPMP